jgi:hypothetical protein
VNTTNRDESRSVLPLAEAQRRLGKPGRPRTAPPPDNVGAQAVRLLGLRDAARYLGVSERTARELDAAGVLRRVRIPAPSGAEVRRLLYDRADLDALIEAWKDRAP